MNNLYVLGGNDAEMVAIKSLLSLAGEKWVQPNPGWGDHIYAPIDVGVEMEEKLEPTGGGQGYNRDYDKKILRAKGSKWDEGLEVVFVECKPAEAVWGETPTTVVDHHGGLAWMPASVIQVLELLSSRTLFNGSVTVSRPFHVSQDTLRWFEIIAANDTGYIPAMEALGATSLEIERVRKLDRFAQGISKEQEFEAERAIREKEVVGRLTLVRMSHSKSATICDRLYGHYNQLLIISMDGESNFFGDGEVCLQLKEKFGGWSGGSGLGKKGENGFWGCNDALNEAVLAFIKNALS